MLRTVAKGRRSLVALILMATFWLVSAHSMDLIHYDVDSLVYLSTDIVIAKVSIDDHHEKSATVEETIYGSLRPGDKVQQLSPFLMFFKPMDDGMRVVLFLDRRPRTYDFIHQDAAKAPFAVAPSGVYLIDTLGHVHQYFQESNPGPYVAQGYSFFALQKDVPTPERDLKLPSLEQTRREIMAAIQSVDRMRAVLDRKPGRNDLPQMFSLLDSRAKGGTGCGRQGDAISERLMEQVRSFDDPALLLKLRTMAVDFTSDISFVQRDGTRDPSLSETRVAYLLRVLADRSAELSLRIAAADTLTDLSRFRNHTDGENESAKSWIIDNEWLNNSAAQIRNLAQTIFENDEGDLQLRSICLGFLPLDDPVILAEVKQIYLTTDSDQLRYSIERAFLQVSDSLYESLNPSSGSVTSIVRIATHQDCVIGRATGPVFVMRYGQERSFHETDMFAQKFYSLTNLETGTRVAPLQVQYLGGWSSMNDGESHFVLGNSSNLAPGRYQLRFEEAQPSRKVLSVGYPVVIVVKQTPGGNSIAEDRSALRPKR